MANVIKLFTSVIFLIYIFSQNVCKNRLEKLVRACALAYYKILHITDVESFITLTPGQLARDSSGRSAGHVSLQCRC